MINKTTQICIFLSLLLLAGVFVVQGYGFVSYEDDNKMIIWDNVKLSGSGLKMGGGSIYDVAPVADGNLIIDERDLYLRKFVGFDCPADYPTNTNCGTAMGDVGGNIFLTIDLISGSSLELIATDGDIALSNDNQDIQFKRKLNLDQQSLKVTDNIRWGGNKALLTDEMNADELKSTGTIEVKSPIQIKNFTPLSIIDYSL